MLSKLKRLIYRWRSSITGRWVSKEHAEANPDTTVREARHIKGDKTK